MKKILLFGLALLLLSSALFADDAKTMPARLGRLYLAPSYMFANKLFNDDGDRKDYGTGGGSVKAFNIGAALEYGPIEWMTIAIQWAPGINVWSDVDRTIPAFDIPGYMGGGPLMIGASDDANAFGVGDIFFGLKFQILGNQGLVKNDMFRLAFAPGIKIPLPGPDYEEQAENALKAEAITPGNVDKHTLAIGLRSYFDFVVNKYFFVNFYNESLFYVMKKDAKKAGYMEYVFADALDKMNADVDVDVKYGYELTFELEPVFTYMLTPKIQFNAGLPINYKTAPGRELVLSGSDAAVAGIEAMLPNFSQLLVKKEDQSHLLLLKPNVSFFFVGWKLPMEFKLSYFAPLWGMNERAGHTLSFQIRMYFKI